MSVNTRMEKALPMLVGGGLMLAVFIGVLVLLIVVMKKKKPSAVEPNSDMAAWMLPYKLRNEDGKSFMTQNSSTPQSPFVDPYYSKYNDLDRYQNCQTCVRMQNDPFLRMRCGRCSPGNWISQQWDFGTQLIDDGPPGEELESYDLSNMRPHMDVDELLDVCASRASQMPSCGGFTYDVDTATCTLYTRVSNALAFRGLMGVPRKETYIRDPYLPDLSVSSDNICSECSRGEDGIMACRSCTTPKDPTNNEPLHGYQMSYNKVTTPIEYVKMVDQITYPAHMRGSVDDTPEMSDQKNTARCSMCANRCDMLGPNGCSAFLSGPGSCTLINGVEHNQGGNMLLQPGVYVGKKFSDNTRSAKRLF